MSAHRPSETGVVLGRLVRALPAEAQDDLIALLSHRLTYITPGRARELRLGLLIEMVANSQGSIPTADSYEKLRRERTVEGETWPTASTLSRGYNGWDRAVRAAMRTSAVRGTGVSTGNKHVGWKTAFTRTEVIDAFVRFRREVGCWPTIVEYQTWSRDLRRLARKGGRRDPRVPSQPQIERTCGSFQRAIALAKREWRRQAAGSTP